MEARWGSTSGNHVVPECGLSAETGLGEAEVSALGQVWVLMCWYNTEHVCKEE